MCVCTLIIRYATPYRSKHNGIYIGQNTTPRWSNVWNRRWIFETVVAIPFATFSTVKSRLADFGVNDIFLASNGCQLRDGAQTGKSVSWTFRRETISLNEFRNIRNKRHRKLQQWKEINNEAWRSTYSASENVYFFFLWKNPISKWVNGNKIRQREYEKMKMTIK